jgi:hypothetical protein
VEDLTDDIVKLEALATVTPEGPTRNVLLACTDGLKKAQDAVNEALDERDDARETLSKIRPRLDVLEAEKTEAVTMLKHAVLARSQEKRAAIRKSATRLISKSELASMQRAMNDLIADLHSEEARKDKVIDAFYKSVAKWDAEPDDEIPVKSVAKHLADLAKGAPEHLHDDLDDEHLLRPRPLFREV